VDLTRLWQPGRCRSEPARLHGSNSVGGAAWFAAHQAAHCNRHEEQVVRVCVVLLTICSASLPFPVALLSAISSGSWTLFGLTQMVCLSICSYDHSPSSGLVHLSAQRAWLVAGSRSTLADCHLSCRSKPCGFKAVRNQPGGLRGSHRRRVTMPSLQLALQHVHPAAGEEETPRRSRVERLLHHNVIMRLGSCPQLVKRHRKANILRLVRRKQTVLPCSLPRPSRKASPLCHVSNIDQTMLGE
jgi:hypothetical protein